MVSGGTPTSNKELLIDQMINFHDRLNSLPSEKRVSLMPGSTSRPRQSLGVCFLSNLVPPCQAKTSKPRRLLKPAGASRIYLPTLGAQSCGCACLNPRLCRPFIEVAKEAHEGSQFSAPELSWLCEEGDFSLGCSSKPDGCSHRPPAWCPIWPL